MLKKSGFSLVELTIVLIIIGIIIAMFMGGMNFMEKARIKTELGKLTKFSSAMTTYYTQNGTVPPALNTTGWGQPTGIVFYEPTAFEDFGLTRDDFKSNYQRTKTDGSYLFASCWLEKTGTSPDILYNYKNTGDNVTLDDRSHTVCIYLNDFHAQFVCNLERSVDDKNVRRGDGLVWNSASSDFGAGSDGRYDNATSCDNLTGNGPYGYKVFQY
jgi:prepilin-type N-terminal cleavage/methylation domain-containing protein